MEVPTSHIKVIYFFTDVPHYVLFKVIYFFTDVPHYVLYAIIFCLLSIVKFRLL